MFADFDGLGLELHLLLEYPRRIQGVVDQRGYAFHGPADLAQALAHVLGLQTVAAALYALRGAVDDGNRRAELVRNHGHELALQRVQFLFLCQGLLDHGRLAAVLLDAHRVFPLELVQHVIESGTQFGGLVAGFDFDALVPIGLAVGQRQHRALQHPAAQAGPVFRRVQALDLVFRSDAQPVGAH